MVSRYPLAMISPLLIRADAGGVLGTGHVMRMLALAQAWQERGGKVVIASVSCPERLTERLEREGIITKILPSSELGRAADVNETLALAKKQKPEWLVLDGYHFDLDYQQAVHEAGFKVMVMDDYGHCERYCADLLLNQNIGSEGKVYDNQIKDAGFLLGPSFALLRKEFWEIDVKSRCPRNSSSRICNVLITLGGVDHDNVTGRILACLNRSGSPALNIRVIVGPGNNHVPALKDLIKQSRHRIEFLYDVVEMSVLYSWADGVISGGGSTCYEWMRFEIPAAVVTLADNQLPIVQELRALKGVVDLGPGKMIGSGTAATLLEGWLEGVGAFNSGACQSLIDGSGALRVAARLSGKEFWLRAAIRKDVLAFFELVNDPDVRSNAIVHDIISLEEHVKWFDQRLDSRDCYLFAAFSPRDSFIGQVRFELTPEEKDLWTISFSLVPNARGMGLGRELVVQGVRCLVRSIKSQLRIRAFVRSENKASLTTLNRLGFKLNGGLSSANLKQLELAIPCDSKSDVPEFYR